MYVYIYIYKQCSNNKYKMSTKNKRTEDNDNKKAKYVHVFSNPAYHVYGENVYKISYSKLPEQAERHFCELYPEQTIVVYTNKHNNARSLE